MLSKQAIVIGPTPPGTGVIALATLETSSKSTSPTKPESVLLIPTSITIAPFFTQSPLTSFGMPTAAIIISALRHSALRFFVFEGFYQMLTWIFYQNHVARKQPTLSYCAKRSLRPTAEKDRDVIFVRSCVRASGL